MTQDLIPNFIAGEWTSATATEVLTVKDPASGDTLGRVPMSAKGDVDRAVHAAAQAFPGWRATPALERVRILFRLHQMMEDDHEELARSLTREHGKVIAEARGEVQRGIDSIEHACAIPTLMMGDTLEDIAAGIDCETIRQPLGVFAAVTPYNFPVMIPMWFWPYAIATGNTFVLKPSEKALPGKPHVVPPVLKILAVRDHADGIVAQVEGVADRNGAEALKGARIFVSRSVFPETDDGEFYWVDLIGMSVVNKDGTTLGEVIDLIDTGPHCVLRILPAGKTAPVKPDEEILIPFVNAYVGDVDKAARVIPVDWDLDY